MYTRWKLQRIKQCHARSNLYLCRYIIFHFTKGLLGSRDFSLGGHSQWMEAKYYTIEQAGFLIDHWLKETVLRPSHASKTSFLLRISKLYPHLNLLPVAILRGIEAARSVGLSHCALCTRTVLVHLVLNAVSFGNKCRLDPSLVLLEHNAATQVSGIDFVQLL